MLKRLALAACLWRSALPENAEDRCAHVAFEDVAFAAEFLRSEGVDATPGGWPSARRRVLNYDARACPDPAAPYVATGFRARDRPRKVFGVGLSKTGTTSLHNALLSVGFSNSDMADEFWPAVVDAASEADVLEFWAGGEAARRGSAVAARTKRLFARHTGGTDLPTAAFVDELLAAHPDALFVLTTRRLDDWGRSAFQQFSRPIRGTTIGRNRASAFGAVAFDGHLYRKRYLEHYAKVLRLIPCCQLLVMDVMRGEGWERLAPFLHLDPSKAPAGAFPWINPGISGGPDLTKRRAAADVLFAKGDEDGDGFLAFAELEALLSTLPPPVMPRVAYDNWTTPLIERHWDKSYAGLATTQRDARGMDRTSFFKFCMRLNLVGGINVGRGKKRRPG